MNKITPRISLYGIKYRCVSASNQYYSGIQKGFIGVNTNMLLKLLIMNNVPIKRKIKIYSNYYEAKKEYRFVFTLYEVTVHSRKRYRPYPDIYKSRLEYLDGIIHLGSNNVPDYNHYLLSTEQNSYESIIVKKYHRLKKESNDR